MENLGGLTVRDAMQPLGARLGLGDKLLDTVRRSGAVPQSAFAVVDGTRLAGIITRGALLSAAKKAKQSDTVGQYLPNSPTAAADLRGPIEPLVNAQERLQAEHAAVVVDRGVVVGMITRQISPASEGWRRYRRRGGPRSKDEMLRCVRSFNSSVN